MHYNIGNRCKTIPTRCSTIINSLNIEAAGEALLESPYGIHSLIVYSDMVMLREFLSFCTKKSIEEKRGSSMFGNLL
jgi:hypothetical protein